MSQKPVTKKIIIDEDGDDGSDDDDHVILISTPAIASLSSTLKSQIPFPPAPQPPIPTQHRESSPNLASGQPRVLGVSPAKRKRTSTNFSETLSPQFDMDGKPIANSRSSASPPHFESTQPQSLLDSPSNPYSNADCWCCENLLERNHVRHVHPLLRVTVCAHCLGNLFGPSESSKGTDGVEDDSDNGSCAGCGVVGETILLCDNCPRGFCQLCVLKAHNGRDRAWLDATASADAEWKCLVCSPPSFLQKWQAAFLRLVEQDGNSDDEETTAIQNSNLSEEAKQKIVDGLISELVDCENEKISVLEELTAFDQRDGIDTNEVSLDKLELLRRDACLSDKITHLQEKLESEWNVDLYRLYHALGLFPVIPSEKPGYAWKADEELEKLDALRRTNQPTILIDFADDDLDGEADVEEIQTGDQDEIRPNLNVSNRLGWSDGARPNPTIVAKFTKVEDERMQEKQIRIHEVAETHDRNETMQEEKKEKCCYLRPTRYPEQISKCNYHRGFFRQDSRQTERGTAIRSSNASTALPREMADVSKQAEESQESDAKCSLRSCEHLQMPSAWNSTFFLSGTTESDDCPVTVVNGIAKHLKKHQREGAKFIWRNSFLDLDHRQSDDPVSGCILAHNMGLGKSLTAITVLHTALCHPRLSTKEEKPIFKTAMVIAPVNTLTNWEQEFEKWTSRLDSPLIVHNLANLEKCSVPVCIDRWLQKGGVLLLGEQRFLSLVKSELRKEKLQPDILVLDEAHQMLKNPENKVYVALTGIVTKRRILLTGTPFQNNVTEYYHMVQYARPGAIDGIMEKAEFEKEYRIPIEKGLPTDAALNVVETSIKKQQQLKACLEPIVHRVDASVLSADLKSMQQVVLHVRASKMQTKLYRRYRRLQAADPAKKNFFRTWKSLKKVYNHPGILTLRRENSSCAPAKNDDEEDDVDDNDNWWSSVEKNPDALKVVEHGSKMILLLHILAYADRLGDKVLVFSFSLGTLDFIESILCSENWASLEPSLQEKFGAFGGYVKDRDYVRMDGSTSSGERGDLISQFNDETSATARVFLISSRSGGIGINLPAANRVVLFDSDFNPSIATQCVFRAYRYGQKKEVFCYRLLADGTMEDKIYARSVNKNGVSLRVIDGKSINRCFSQKELDDIQDLSLSWAFCDDCNKWRMLVGEDSEKDLPDKWTCSMLVADSINNKCDAPERDQDWYEDNMLAVSKLSLHSEKDLAAVTDTSLSEEKKAGLVKRDEILQYILKLQLNSKKTKIVSRHYFHEALLEPMGERQDVPTDAPREEPVDTAVEVNGLGSFLVKAKHKSSTSIGNAPDTAQTRLQEVSNKVSDKGTGKTPGSHASPNSKTPKAQLRSKQTNIEPTPLRQRTPARQAKMAHGLVIQTATDNTTPPGTRSSKRSRGSESSKGTRAGDQGHTVSFLDQTKVETTPPSPSKVIDLCSDED